MQASVLQTSYFEDTADTGVKPETSGRSATPPPLPVLTSCDSNELRLLQKRAAVLCIQEMLEYKVAFLTPVGGPQQGILTPTAVLPFMHCCQADVIEP